MAKTNPTLGTLIELARGWIRRLVLTQCHRRLRGTRLELRPEEEGRHVAASSDPSACLFLPIHPDALRRSLREQRDGIVATAGGRLQGLMTASADDVAPDALRLNLVLVRKDQRRHGLASAMLACLLARHDGTSVRLVAPTAADLTAWLTSRGFVQMADRLLVDHAEDRRVRADAEGQRDGGDGRGAGAGPQVSERVTQVFNKGSQ